MLQRLAKTFLIAAVVALVLVPTVAIGSHDYKDVPDSNVFHGDISWMGENEITKGCNPPANDMFCPGDNVTRQQMAAFMRRAAENQVVDAGMLDGMDSTDFVPMSYTPNLMTLTFAAVDVAPGTGVIPGPGIGPVMTLDFEVPVDGSILVTHATSVGLHAGDTAYAMAPTLGTCGAMEFAIAAYGHVETGHEYDNVAGVIPFNVTAGAHTLTYCGSVEANDVNALSFQVGVVYEAGGIAPDIELPPVMSGPETAWE
ncbi:MAG: S-layer homology domain-containing protein [Acidimicrobiia bacterium]|nr:S-layer homology domain-containing protein [Acidimicrobiia bacterium]